jgi:hypothetical protein
MKKIFYLLLISTIIYSCGYNSKKNKKNSNLSVEESSNNDYTDEMIIKTVSLEELVQNNTDIIKLTKSVTFDKDKVIKFDNINDENSIDKNQSLQDQLICINNGSSRSANKIGIGTGGTLYIRFTEANWSGVKNTCGNLKSSNNRFTFPDSRMYQYQMVLFEEAPSARTYFLGTCQEDKTYSIKTKKGFTYYVYTNDTSGDHDDNTGYISYCYGGAIY